MCMDTEVLIDNIRAAFRDAIRLVTVEADRDRLAAELAEARKVLDRLPKTADGALVAPGTKVWMKGHLPGEVEDGIVSMNVSCEGGYNGVKCCYSTREAAARLAGKGGSDAE